MEQAPGVLAGPERKECTTRIHRTPPSQRRCKRSMALTSCVIRGVVSSSFERLTKGGEAFRLRPRTNVWSLRMSLVENINASGLALWGLDPAPHSSDTLSPVGFCGLYCSCDIGGIRVDVIGRSGWSCAELEITTDTGRVYLLEVSVK